MSFAPLITAPGSPTNVSLFLGMRPVVRRWTPALILKIVPSGLALTFACKSSPGKTATPDTVAGRLPNYIVSARRRAVGADRGRRSKRDVLQFHRNRIRRGRP